MILPGHIARGILFGVITLIWVIPAAVQDWRTGEVSHGLTYPPIIVNLGIWLAGWSAASWWLVLLFTGMFLALWFYDQIGAADVRGWIAFSLLGTQTLLAAALGMLVWYLLVQAKIVKLPRKEIPGYPGYAIGLAVTTAISLVVGMNVVL